MVNWVKLVGGVIQVYCILYDIPSTCFVSNKIIVRPLSNVYLSIPHYWFVGACYVFNFSYTLKYWANLD